MNVYLDSEFNDTGKAIDLISIAFVSDSEKKRNKELYLINRDFNVDKAWFKNDGTTDEPNYWLRKNVLYEIFRDLQTRDLDNDYEDYNQFTYENFKVLLNRFGDGRIQMVSNIVNYFERLYKESEIKLYGYYSSYDFVLLCQLFGGMLMLPTYIPNYIRDTKVLVDDIAEEIASNYDISFKEALIALKKQEYEYSNKIYPIQLEGQHNALEDAKWIQELHKFTKYEQRT